MLITNLFDLTSYYVNRGGAIYSTGITMITQCQFINNTARIGGGGLYASGSGLVLTNSTFLNNMATENGGATYIDVRGRGVSIISSLLQCHFINNTAGEFGGSLYVSGTNSSVDVTDSTFINNTAIREGGGAIYSNGQYANVTLTSSTFHNNSASYCGVLDVDNYNHFSVDLTKSVFTYNTASGQTIGGGVACIGNATINIIDSSFKHNLANHHAGVFYIDESLTYQLACVHYTSCAALKSIAFYVCCNCRRQAPTVADNKFELGRKQS